MVRRSPTSEDFYAALEEIKVLHDRKQSDYGRAEAPFANVEKSADFGIEPWVGALVRGNDKMGRLQKAASGGTLSNEGVEDSLMDMAVYALIALVEYRAMNESSYDPYQFDQTDVELAEDWLMNRGRFAPPATFQEAVERAERDRNFDGPPDGYDPPVTNLIGSLFGVPVRTDPALYNDLDDACPPDCPCNTGEVADEEIPNLDPGCEYCMAMRGRGDDEEFIRLSHEKWAAKRGSQ